MNEGGKVKEARRRKEARRAESRRYGTIIVP